MSDTFSRMERSPCLNDSRVRNGPSCGLSPLKFGRQNAELTRELAEPPFANARFQRSTAVKKRSSVNGFT